MQKERHQIKAPNVTSDTRTSRSNLLKSKEHYSLDPIIESYYGTNPEPKNIFLTIRLTPNQMAHLNNISESFSMSKSALIKGLIFSLIPE